MEFVSNSANNIMKRVAVVGGGLSGMVSVAQLKDEGIEPVCFERSDRYGGTWSKYREQSEIGTPSTMFATVLNHSKELGAFSNFPPRKEYNNFMRHSEVNEYCTEYAIANDVLRHMHFNTEVIKVKRSRDYDETGRWDVTVRERFSGVVTKDTYDGVAVCVGHFNFPNMPSYPYQDVFKGKIMHSHSLKGVQDFQGENVVVVGMGCSALDAAVECSSVANQVYLSARSSSHVFSRLSKQGYPIDFLFFRRCFSILLDILPIRWCSWLILSLIDERFHHNFFPVSPTCHVLAKDPVLNDIIGYKIMSGSVKQVHEISRFTENGIIFTKADKNEMEEIKVDTVIMATGYTWKFPFLENGVLEIENGKINLYKCMFPTQLKHSTLAFIGFILVFGPGFPLGEIQCRWMAQVFTKKSVLPSKEIMLRDVDRRHATNVARYTPNEKMTLRVDFIQYMDEIASLFGVKPNLLKLFFTDIRLFWEVAFGPCVAYQYRLQGPHTWNGAREALMTTAERVHWPHRMRMMKSVENRIIRWIKKLIYFLVF